MGFPKKRTLIEATPQLPEELTYQARLRKAVYDGISEADVADVVKSLVVKAKAGDPKAIDMLFKHVLAAETTPQQLVQNNYYGDEAKPKLKRNGEPSKGAPSDSKLSVLRTRAEAGDELFPEEESA